MSAVNSATWTFTFSERVENHKGMQTIGDLAPCGFTLDDLQSIATRAEADGCVTELMDLRTAVTTAATTTTASTSISPPTSSTGDGMAPGAWLLVVRGGLRALLADTAARGELQAETKALDSIVDKKAKMYGRVVDKNARWNLCFADDAQEPDYAAGRGRVVPFSQCPRLSDVRASLGRLCGSKGQNLKAELNYYYDVSKVTTHPSSSFTVVFTVCCMGWGV
jgi:hypothetical protein